MVSRYGQEEYRAPGRLGEAAEGVRQADQQPGAGGVSVTPVVDRIGVDGPPIPFAVVVGKVDECRRGRITSGQHAEDVVTHGPPDPIPSPRRDAELGGDRSEGRCLRRFDQRLEIEPGHGDELARRVPTQPPLQRRHRLQAVLRQPKASFRPGAPDRLPAFRVFGRVNQDHARRPAPRRFLEFVLGQAVAAQGITLEPASAPRLGFAGQYQQDRALEVDPFEIVPGVLRGRDAVAGEDQIAPQLNGLGHLGRPDDDLVALFRLKRGASGGPEGQAELRLDPQERNRLQETRIANRGRQTRLLELRRDIQRRQLLPARARCSTLQ